jgi:Kdo2-lipid IVA lauroyltransferase/acyltransferase
MGRPVTGGVAAPAKAPEPAPEPAPAPTQDSPGARVPPRITLAFRLQYWALRSIVAMLSALGLRTASRFGAALGRVAYSVVGIRRTVVESQVAASFPEMTPAQVRRVAREAYDNLGRTSIETALLPSIGPQGVLDLFEQVDGWEHIEAGLAQGRGLIIVTGHLGNWEIGGAYVAARGIPFAAIARHMANPLVDRYLTDTREGIGMRIIHDEHAVRRAPRALREGHVVAFLADQGLLGLASTWVPFFGRPAKTPRGPAVFALRMGTPVVFGAVQRMPSGRFRLSFEPVHVTPTGDRERDVDRIVAEFTSVLEGWVRRAPGQYFWHHRRWKHAPPCPPARQGETA